MVNLMKFTKTNNTVKAVCNCISLRDLLTGSEGESEAPVQQHIRAAVHPKPSAGAIP